MGQSNSCHTACMCWHVNSESVFFQNFFPIMSIIEAPAGTEDDHAFRLSYNQLRDLLSLTGFSIEKEHWQKPPWTYVIYLSARAVKPGQ
jgi:hypothetical protein